jgi:putative PIN family toxin of toxin-antitoxin system
MLDIVVADTNVLISGFWSTKGSPAQIVDLIDEAEIFVCYNDPIMAEYRFVSSRPKFEGHIDQNDFTIFLSGVEKVGVRFMPAQSTFPMPDESDRIFYDTAKQAGAILITGNIKHFPVEPFIMTPGDFIRRYRQEQEKVN